MIADTNVCSCVISYCQRIYFPLLNLYLVPFFGKLQQVGALWDNDMQPMICNELHRQSVVQILSI